jgi:glycosyltransferase involved in cell wall biosynthesis
VASRLLLDVGPAMGRDGSRGIGRYVRGLARSISTLDAERRERIWAIGLSGPDLASFGDRGLVSRRLGVRPLDTGWLLGARALRDGTRTSSAAVLHNTDPHRPWKSRRVKQIVTAYDLIPLHDAALLATWRPHHRWVYRHYLAQLRAADLIVAISRATADDLAASLGISADRIHIVYPVVGTPPPLRRDPSDVPTFMWLGALDAHKQPELAIEAMARLRARGENGRLSFIGPGSVEQRRGLARLADRLGIRDAVTLSGWIPDDELDRAFVGCTALLLTSRIEGFGLPPVEAALRGLPVIAVDTPAARETIGSVATLTPADADALAEAMARTIGAPLVPDAAAIARLAERFSVEAAAAALWSVYEHVL